MSSMALAAGPAAAGPAAAGPAAVSAAPSADTAGLAERLDALAGVPVQTLSVPDLQRLVGELSPLGNRLAGLVSRALGELDVRGGGTVPAPDPDRDKTASPSADGDGGKPDSADADGGKPDGGKPDGGEADSAEPDNPDQPVRTCSTVSWLREEANLSPRRAGQALRIAVALRALPEVAAAVLAGTISIEHAGVLARLVPHSDPGVLAECGAALVEVAARVDPDSLAHYVRHLLATWHEPVLDEDERRAEARRYVQLTDSHDGTWRGRLVLASAAMESVLVVLEPLARRAGDEDSRGAGQRRADALVEVFEQVLRHGELPEAGGERPRVTVVVPAEWAAGSDGAVGATGATGSAGSDTTDTTDSPDNGADGLGSWATPISHQAQPRRLADPEGSAGPRDALGNAVGASTAHSTPIDARTLDAWAARLRHRRLHRPAQPGPGRHAEL